MSEMIERVGRALAQEDGYAYDPLPYDARAKAAIQAMREPTNRMVDAFYVDHYGQAVTAWKAMIDEALKPTTSRHTP